MAGTTTIAFSVSEHVAQELPVEPGEREQVLELGLKEWRVRRALDSSRGDQGTLAHAAAQAGVALREMIPLASAHGLRPRGDERWLSEPLSLDTASTL